MSTRRPNREYIPDFLVDYVSCVNLREFPFYRYTWRTHTNERVFYASLLALYYARYDRLRYYAERIAERYRISYRRLMYYAEAIDTVDTNLGEGYGKLIEATIYGSIESPSRQKRKWLTNIEVRVYIPAPLFVDVKLLADNEDFWNKVKEIVSIFAEYRALPPVEEWTEVEADGIREVIDFFGEKWCNSVSKVELDRDIEVEWVHIRGKEYRWSGSGRIPYNIYDLDLDKLFLEVHRIEPL